MSSYRTLSKVREFLFETGKTLFAETDLGKLLPLAMDKVIEQTKAENGMIIVYGPKDELLFQVARDRHQKDITQPEVSTKIIQRVRESGKYYVYVPDDTEKNLIADKSQSSLLLGIQSAAGAPLRHEGKFLGVIYIDNRSMKATFKDETGELLSEFAELISVAVNNALKLQRLESEAAQKERYRQLVKLLTASEGFDEIIGIKSMAMLEVLNLIKKAAPTGAPVLIVGETGAGKGIVAQAVYNNSLRAEQTFVKVNCAGFAENLVESDLFGHMKGAFTGAVNDKMGYFETADGGTIFLDEIAKSSASVQTKLLGVLESGEFRRLGETTAKPRQTDVRVIAAVGPNIHELIAQDRFYLDLFHRLKVVEIYVPPLRERREDIPELANFFLRRYAKECQKTIHDLSPEIHELLLRYHWPGNVRELQHAIESAVIHTDSEIIQAYDLPRDVYGRPSEPTVPPVLPYAAAKKNWELGYFSDLLHKTNGIISEVARLTGMDKSNLSKKLRDLGINAKDFEK